MSLTNGRDRFPCRKQWHIIVGPHGPPYCGVVFHFLPLRFPSPLHVYLPHALCPRPHANPHSQLSPSTVALVLVLDPPAAFRYSLSCRHSVRSFYPTPQPVALSAFLCPDPPIRNHPPLPVLLSLSPPPLLSAMLFGRHTHSPSPWIGNI